MCERQVVRYVVLDNNRWYTIYRRQHSTTYSAELCGLDAYHYSAGHSNIESAEAWISATLAKMADADEKAWADG